MMPDRQMFWRVIRRILSSNRARLAVILLALGSGAAITAALLNLEVDAKRRLTSEFAVFGPNVIVAPRDSRSTTGSQPTLDQSILNQIPRQWHQRAIRIFPYLYVVADARKAGSAEHAAVVVAGRTGAFLTTALKDYGPSGAIWKPAQACELGAHVSARMQVQASDVVLQNDGRQETCHPSMGPASGGPEDDQIAIPLADAQELADLPTRLSLVELTVAGTPEEISTYISSLQQSLPDAEVRPIRQFTEGEAKIYNRISGILSATVGVVLILTALCVMAAMTNVAMERRNDVGLMKAIGGATRRVLRLFLAEAALLGLAGGLIGAALGILLSIWLGKQVFGQPAHPRLIVYPVAVGLTMIVAIAGAYPLRRLANVRPASVFRGEA